MATERIDIVVSERGSRTVRRNLEDIGRTSQQSAGGVDLLKRALTTLGIAATAREMLRLVDSSTQLQNRLKAAGVEGANLSAVYQELLKTANSTRSSFEGSVELFSRLAISSKELGVSQRELIDFTNSLNQYIMLSGTSAQEAEAGLIQLSQGMASGVLRGDELRSVLEQLPAVADVIAKSLGVTRGELRQLGTDGKITANTILNAFREAKDELSERFAKTVPTISQSFVVLRNNVLNAVGDLDKLLNVSGSISAAILSVAHNVPQLTQALVDLTKVLITAGAAYGSFLASQKISVISAAISSFIQYHKAIAAGTAVTLGSAEADRQKTLATYRSAVADAAATGSALSLARAEEASALAKLNNTKAGASLLAAERALEVTRLQAQISDIGRTQSLTRLAEIRRAEVALVQVIAREEAALNAVRTAGVAADNARAASLTRLQQAQKANAAATATAAGTTSLLGQAITPVKAAFLALFAIIAANPITALVVVLVSAATALTMFRNEISLGVDKVTTLGDLLKALGEVVGPVFRSMYNAAKDLLGPIFTLISDWFGEVEFSVIGVLRVVARGVDNFVGFWKGAISAVIELFGGLPSAMGDLFTTALNFLLKKISNFVNKAGELLSTVTEFAGLGKIATLDLQLTNENEGAARNLGEGIATAFKDGFESTHFAEDFLSNLSTRAQEIAKARVEAEAAQAGSAPDLGARGSSGILQTTPSATEVSNLREELDQLMGSYHRVYAAQQEWASSLATLNAAQEAGLITDRRKAELLELIKLQLQDSLDPLGAVNRQLDEEQRLLAMDSETRAVSVRLRAIEQDMLGQGIVLTEQELSQLRERLELLQNETRAMQTRDGVMRSILDPQREFTDQLAAINQLLAEGVINQSQANQFLVEQSNGLLEGTIEAQQALVAQYEQTFAQIDMLRQNDLISEETAVQIKARLNAQLYEQQLSGARQFFGSLASLSRSENRELAAIGKAAAVTQATIDGVLAVQKALASSPPPMNYALAAAVGIQTASNVAKIMAQTPGFAFGGDFTVGGTGGTDSQMVAFRATPGERVSVSTPQQDRDRGRATAEASPQSPKFNIINVVDPSVLGNYLETDEGAEIIMNVVQRNGRSTQGY